MDIVAIVIGLFGILVAFLAVIWGDKLAGMGRRLVSGKKVVVWGPPAVGKTSLSRYLAGKPIPDKHDPTFQPEVYSGALYYNLTGGPPVYLRLSNIIDTPGEPTHKGKREWSVKKYNPHGIILLSTPRDEDVKATRSDIDDLIRLYGDILTARPIKKVKLRVILICLNKMDEWGSNKGDADTKLARFQESVKPNITDLQLTFNQKLSVIYGMGSLKERQYIERTKDALSEFGETLALRTNKYDDL